MTIKINDIRRMFKKIPSFIIKWESIIVNNNVYGDIFSYYNLKTV